jgi:hypothetical protein
MVFSVFDFLWRSAVEFAPAVACRLDFPRHEIDCQRLDNRSAPEYAFPRLVVLVPCEDCLSRASRGTTLLSPHEVRTCGSKADLRPLVMPAFVGVLRR